MTLVKPLLASALVALSLLGASTSRAQARDTIYAVVGIHNPTDLTIRYAFQWGDIGLLYRYLHYSNGGDKVVDTLALHGPLLEVRFHF